ncbi:MAG TPA: MerR family DNA-binding protein [Euzebyales bacterium]|nr:MerR family DNA-binding protein [Euzebyales bacterium]
MSDNDATIDFGHEVQAVERIRLAKALQAHGFTLDEVIDALHSFETGTTCADERWRLERVVDRIDRQLDELRALRDTVLDTAGGL